jgi:hypothetical protein
MYKLLTSVIIVLFLYSTISYSQSPIKSTAKNLLSTAVSQAKTDGLPNPLPISIGTMTGVLTGVPLIGSLTLEFDLSTGKASAWAIAMYDKSLDSIKIYGVLEFPILGKIAMNLGADQVGAFMQYIVKEEITGNWKDSDEMMQIVGNNSIYKTFKSQYPNHILKIVGLGVNTQNTFIEIGKPYWAAQFIDESTNTILACWIQALTGDCSCTDITSVYEKIITKANLEIFPNPSADIINITIPEELTYQDGIIEVMDITGSKIKETAFSQLNTGSVIPVKLSECSNGLYFIKLVSNGKIYSSPLIISR